MYDTESMGCLLTLSALRTLEVEDWPAPLAALTQLECLFANNVGDPEAFETALGQLRGLTTLALYSQAPERPPPFSHLRHLQRLCLCTTGCDLADLSLPSGPWLASIRWLGLNFDVLTAAVDLLCGAPQLEYLCCLDCPERTAGEMRPQWRAFWEFAATHSPLRCLGFVADDGNDFKLLLIDALLHLKERRPALQLRRYDDIDAFRADMLNCDSIPAGSGTSF